MQAKSAALEAYPLAFHAKRLDFGFGSAAVFIDGEVGKGDICALSGKTPRAKLPIPRTQAAHAGDKELFFLHRSFMFLAMFCFVRKSPVIVAQN